MTVVAPVRIDVGVGAKAEEGWVTLDVVPYFKPAIWGTLADLPMADNTVDEIRCWHVLEHIERKDLIAVMNEMWRVLKPGGAADIEVPLFPYWPAIADPTHVSFFVPQTFAYFCTGESYHRAIRGAKAFEDHHDHRTLYAIKEWVMRKAFRNENGSVLRVELVKP